MREVGQEPPSAKGVQRPDRGAPRIASTHRRRPPTEEELLQSFRLTASQSERAMLRHALAVVRSP